MVFLFLVLPAVSLGASAAYGKKIYDPGLLAPLDSELLIGLGQSAPDFTLPAVSGKSITLSRFRGKKNVLISFIPAAWTPVCSHQWPGYNIAKPLFEAH
ncbi:MAG: redoxin domain-containing protein, partial [Proteobacteria bacterium]|nr:redoxin domain-containing protein [Pseudomonadota bacterium]